jgi:hypothetical protein
MAIAEFGLWSEALSEAEFRSLRFDASPAVTRPRSLVHHMPLRVPNEIGLRGRHPTFTGTTITAHPTMITPYKKRVLRKAPVAAASAVGHYYRNHLMARRRMA